MFLILWGKILGRWRIHWSLLLIDIQCLNCWDKGKEIDFNQVVQQGARSKACLLVWQAVIDFPGNQTTEWCVIVISTIPLHNIHWEQQGDMFCGVDRI